jgi:hypothetical protein
MRHSGRLSPSSSRMWEPKVIVVLKANAGFPITTLGNDGEKIRMPLHGEICWVSQALPRVS